MRLTPHCLAEHNSPDAQFLGYPPMEAIKVANLESHITISDLHGNIFKLLDVLIIEGVLLIREDDYKELYRIVHLPVEEQSPEDISYCIKMLQERIGYCSIQCLRLIGDECGDRGINDFWTLCLIDQISRYIPVEILLSNHGNFLIKYMEDNFTKSSGVDYLLDTVLSKHIDMLNRIRKLIPEQAWYDYLIMNKPNEIIKQFSKPPCETGSIREIFDDLSNPLFEYKGMMSIVDQRRSLINMHVLLHQYPVFLSNLKDWYGSYKRCLRIVSYSIIPESNQLTIYTHAPTRVRLMDEMCGAICPDRFLEPDVTERLMTSVNQINIYFQNQLQSNQWGYGSLSDFIWDVTWATNIEPIDEDNSSDYPSVMMVHGHTTKTAIRPDIGNPKYYGIDNFFQKTEYLFSFYLWEYFRENKALTFKKTHLIDDVAVKNTLYFLPTDNSACFHLMMSWHYSYQAEGIILIDNISLKISVKDHLFVFLNAIQLNKEQKLSYDDSYHMKVVSHLLPCLDRIYHADVNSKNVCLVSTDKPMVNCKSGPENPRSDIGRLRGAFFSSSQYADKFHDEKNPLTQTKDVSVTAKA